MSEHEPLLHGLESHREGGEAKAEQNEKLKELIEKAGHSKEKSVHEVEKLAHNAKEKAVSGKDRLVDHLGKESSRHSSLVIDKAVKYQAYQKTLKGVRHHLPPAQRAFSKLIHQPTIEKVSELGSKTIARPSGLLGGGFFALLGTTIVIWMSRHYGFRYNYFVIVGLMIGGFFAGLALELFIRLGTKLFRRG
jgi:hypothetical protein